jgi:hypothetical protein
VEKISLAVNNYFASLEGAEIESATPEAEEGAVEGLEAAPESVEPSAPLQSEESSLESAGEAAEAPAVEQTEAETEEAGEEHVPSSGKQ